MPRNKARLQLALYARPKHPGTYHWALFITAKDDLLASPSPTTKHHVKNNLLEVAGEIRQPWRYERVQVPDVHLEQRLLVRVTVAKIAVPEKLDRILEAIPVYQIDDPNQAEARKFSCSMWVWTALEELKRQEVIAGVSDSEVVRRKAVEYVERKKGDGRWEAGWKGDDRVPTLDLLVQREIIA